MGMAPVLDWLRRKRPAATRDDSGLPQRESPDARMVRARALLAEGQPSAAGALAEQVAAEHPEHAPAHLLIGSAALACGDAQEAADALRLALHYDPALAEAHLRLGAALQALGRRGEAAACFARAVEVAPGSAQAWRRLGLARLEDGDAEAAADALVQALERSPQSAPLLNDLGYVLGRHLGRTDEAIALLERALAADPACVDAFVNRGMLRQQSGELDAALEDYERALALQDVPEARLNRGLLRLAGGDFAGAWPDYEARMAVQGPALHGRYPFPRWDGSRLAGRTLLVYGEQGLGDEIMFAGCLPDVVAAARQVILQCSPRLAALFRRSFPGARVHGGGQTDADLGWLAALPRPDAMAGIGSLPGFLRRRHEDFPRHAGYLQADPDRVRHWRERLASAGPGRPVGLSWRGGTASTRRAARSLDLETLLPVLRVPGVCFVSLQYGECREEIDRVARAHGIRLVHFQEAVDDLDEMAALICAVDEVVSVCTAAIHLAGALGRPTRVLVPAVPEWRYLRSGDGMPWYPSVVMHRQRAAGEWGDVVGAVARHLTR